jgi:protein-S-isoprenylcysteine O-methyltransferase Ste14
MASTSLNERVLATGGVFVSTVSATTETTIEGCVPVADCAATSAAPAPIDAELAKDALRLDWVEKVFVLVLYAWLVSRILVNYFNNGGLTNLLLLPSEGVVVIFLLVRRRTNSISRSPVEWILAMAATCVPLFVTPGVGHPLIPPSIAAAVLLVGIFLQVHAKFTLGRSFGCVPAHRGLKLEGPYRFVRHPMYAGYLLSHLAFFAVNPTLWNVAIYSLAYLLQIPRLLAEERLLSRDPGYSEYKSVVRYRLIPLLF